MTTLLEYLRFLEETRPPGPSSFTPGVRYNRLGDFLEAYWSDCCPYAEQLSPEITLMRDIDTREIVGIKLHGVRAAMAAVELLAREPRRQEMAERWAKWKKLTRPPATP